MLSKIKRIFELSFGPSIIIEYGKSEYKISSTEKFCSQILSTVNFCWKMSIYAAPLLAFTCYIIKYDITGYKSFGSVINMAITLGIVLSSCIYLKGYSRSLNSQYVRFFNILTEAKADPQNHFDSIRKYDFDFWAWPVDFDCEKRKRFGSFTPVLKNEKNDSITKWPMKILAEIAMRTFALKLLYPGSIYILQLSINQHLVEGRTKLVEVNGGRRHKVRAIDGNEIDVMFVNRRGKTTNGTTLVIASEGNAGFYEVGIMCTPLDAGYSVLGWNHPGFAGSSGQPYPEQEHRAMDAVMQFAISLGFQPHDIVLFGWSIGSYPSAWAAVQYPNIRGVVLDAAFDDVLPLALSKMPASWKGLVTEVIRSRADLRVAEILDGYRGPIKFVRRTADEIICLEEGILSTNRGNNLLLHVLKKRFPGDFDEEGIEFANKFLGLRGPPLVSFLQNASTNKSKRVLTLINDYLVDYQSSHCTPLPAEYFQIPHEVFVLGT